MRPAQSKAKSNLKAPDHHAGQVGPAGAFALEEKSGNGGWPEQLRHRAMLKGFLDHAMGLTRQ